MIKKRLFTPGPTPVPEQVYAAMSRPIIHHRHKEFKEIFKRTNENLKYLFRTKNDVFTLACSGTGAMEAAVTNLLSPKDRALYVNGGKFGSRWGEICRAYGVKTDELKVEWGGSADPDEIGNRLKKKNGYKCVFVTHTETSTGALTDIREISRVVRRYSDTVLVVDGISSVGAIQIETDEWGIDAVITASQKGLMVPPGLAFITLGKRGNKLIERSALPKYYFDLKKSKKALADLQTSWTPATSLLFGLDAALEMIRTEGIENVWKRHKLLAAAFRAGIGALGLKLLADSPSDALTAVWIPSSIDGPSFLDTFKNKYGFIVAGGQGRLKGKIFRVAHIGHYDRFDVISVLSGLEMSLRSSGWKFEPGTGVSAAERIFLNG